MRKLVQCLIFVLLFLTLHTANASVNDYEWVEQYNFSCKKIIEMYNTKANGGDWAYSLYYFADPKNPNNKCLVYIGHGYYGKKGYYLVDLGNKGTYDYATAVAENIALAVRKGYIRNMRDFSYVFIASCYSGYAPRQRTKLPIWNIPLVFANMNKYVNGHREIYDQNGNVKGLVLYYAVNPKTKITALSGGMPFREQRKIIHKAPQGLKIS